MGFVQSTGEILAGRATGFQEPLPVLIDFKARIARGAVISVRVLGDSAVTPYIAARTHFISRNIAQIAPADWTVLNIGLRAWEVGHEGS